MTVAFGDPSRLFSTVLVASLAMYRILIVTLACFPGGDYDLGLLSRRRTSTLAYLVVGRDCDLAVLLWA